MKTIEITVVSAWVNEEAQRKLEKNLSQLPELKDFVFNEQGNLEVTFDESENIMNIFNLCNISIQHAVYQSGKDKGIELESSEKLLFI